MKECRTCKEVKDLTEYYKDKGARDGRTSSCKTCRNKVTRAWIENNRERRRKHVADFSKKNPEWVTAKTQKRRAMKIASTVDLTDNLYMKRVFEFYGMKCLKCGKEEVTLDHVVPLSLGGSHRYKNFQTLCGPCNYTKGNRNSNDYRDFKYRGVLAGFVFDEPMVITRPA